MHEVDLELGGAAFLDDGVDLQVLQFGELVDVIDDLVVFVHGPEAVGLTARAFAAGAARRGFERIIRIGVGFGQVEFELRCDDRRPAFFGVEVHHTAENRARGDFYGIAVLPRGVVDDLGRRARGPGGRADRGEVGNHHQVALGIERLTVFFKADVIAVMVWWKMEIGRWTGSSFTNFSTGMVLPRATPAMSGTAQSTSSIRWARTHARTSSAVVPKPKISLSPDPDRCSALMIAPDVVLLMSFQLAARAAEEPEIGSNADQFKYLQSPPLNDWLCKVHPQGTA